MPIAQYILMVNLWALRHGRHKIKCKNLVAQASSLCKALRLLGETCPTGKNLAVSTSSLGEAKMGWF
jgi:hypothetical protein